MQRKTKQPLKRKPHIRGYDYWLVALEAAYRYHWLVFEKVPRRDFLEEYTKVLGEE